MHAGTSSVMSPWLPWMMKPVREISNLLYQYWFHAPQAAAPDSVMLDSPRCPVLGSGNSSVGLRYPAMDTHSSAWGEYDGEQLHGVEVPAYIPPEG